MLAAILFVMSLLGHASLGGALTWPGRPINGGLSRYARSPGEAGQPSGKSRQMEHARKTSG